MPSSSRLHYERTKEYRIGAWEGSAALSCIALVEDLNTMMQRVAERPWCARAPLRAVCVLVGMLVVTGGHLAVHAGSRLVDLTYSFDESTLVWPRNLPFHREGSERGGTVDEAWYATGQVALSEHAGTHMDAPSHFAKGQVGIDGIPVGHLIGPAVLVDVRAAVATQMDYRLSLDDLRGWEVRHGTIPDGAVVMMLTGWGTHWKNRDRYFGSATPDVPSTLHFPGFSEEAARFLVAERHIVGIGIDTPSIDYGPSQHFEVHRIINGAGLYGLENVARLEELPPSGATLIALPMKIAGGSGAPVRIVGIIPE